MSLKSTRTEEAEVKTCSGAAKDTTRNVSDAPNVKYRLRDATHEAFKADHITDTQEINMHVSDEQCMDNGKVEKHTEVMATTKTVDHADEGDTIPEAELKGTSTPNSDTKNDAFKMDPTTDQKEANDANDEDGGDKATDKDDTDGVDTVKQTSHVNEGDNAPPQFYLDGPSSLCGGAHEGGMGFEVRGPSLTERSDDNPSFPVPVLITAHTAGSGSSDSVSSLQTSLSSISLSSRTGRLELTEHFDACLLYAEENRRIADDIKEKICSMFEASEKPKICLFDDEDKFGATKPARKIDLIKKHCTSLFIIITEELVSKKEEEDYPTFLRDTLLMASVGAKGFDIRPVLLSKEDNTLIPTELKNTSPINWYLHENNYFKDNIRKMFQAKQSLRLLREQEIGSTAVQ